MKTIKNVDSEIKASQDYIKNNLSKISDAGYKKEQRKIEFLKQMKMYLETNPNEDFITQEQTRLVTIIKSKESQFEYWRKNVASDKIKPKDLKAVFNKEIGINEFKKSLKTINYLLS